MELGCHVFCAFIDFTKAFDRVNYWKLFNKLLGDMEFYNYGVVGYYHFAIHIRKFVFAGIPYLNALVLKCHYTRRNIVKLSILTKYS